MNYRDEVIRTLNGNLGAADALLTMGGLGLAGEAGEVADLIKKVVYHNKPMDRQALIKELGDVCYYLETVMMAIGTDIEQVKAANIEKLRVRYPDGFSYEAANNKADERGLCD